LTITPTGWVQEEENLKVVLDEGGRPLTRQPVVAQELGLNRYERLAHFDDSAGRRYRERTEPFWQEVQAAWEEIIATRDRFRLRAAVAFPRPRPGGEKMPLPRGPRFPMFAGVRLPSSPKDPPVLGVGRRVVVTCRKNGSDRVTLTDENGTSALATVADGVEVEILAWRPRRGGDTRYRVVSTSGGIEGWLGAASLKPREPSLAPKIATAAPAGRLALPTRTPPGEPQRTRR